MYKYQYKERNYAEDILNNGFTSKHVATELKILAKYYKECGHEDEELKELLQTFCKKNLNGYNQALHFKIINSAVNHAKNDKNKLIQIDNISISKKELDYISNLDLIHDFKRVVFTILVLTKLSKKYIEIKDVEKMSNEYYFGGHKKFRDLVSTSHITFNKTKKSTAKNIHDLIHIFNEKGIVEIIGNGNIKLNFMYEIEENNDVEILVDNFNVIGLYYDFYYGENRVKKCEECGVLIKASNNRQLFCKDCWCKREIEIKREWDKTKRKR